MFSERCVYRRRTFLPLNLIVLPINTSYCSLLAINVVLAYAWRDNSYLYVCFARGSEKMENPIEPKYMDTQD